VTWLERQREHALKCALEEVLLLTAERVASMRDGCTARKSAIGAMNTVNAWMAARAWPYDE